MVKVVLEKIFKNHTGNFFMLLSTCTYREGHGSSFEQTLITFTPGCFVPSLFETGQGGSEGEIDNV